jgi:hypothetical protein
MRSAEPISAVFLFGEIPGSSTPPRAAPAFVNERLISHSMKLWSLGSIVTWARSVQTRRNG